jgi:ABC-2 type transport system ATP-binding protein
MNALEIHQLCKVYDNGVEALKGVNLSVKTGDFFALLGVNGAGKSTTIGAITTLLNKTSGRILIHGFDLDQQPQSAKAHLGLVPQELNLNIFETCTNILINQAGFYGIDYRQAKIEADRLLKQLGLFDKRNTIVRHLSGGMKRRLMIARALIHRPKILILDEPTAGVDIEIRRNIWDFLSKANLEGTTIILTTHYLEEAEQLCKNIAIIDGGHIIEHTSVQALLKTLSHQTFLFNTMEPIDILPDLEPLEGLKIDANTFELRIENRFTLNDVFNILNHKGLRIHSMRNKTNRLEELFLDLIHHDA